MDPETNPEVVAPEVVPTETPVEATPVEPTELPPEYVEAGNVVYSGTSEMGKDVGRHYDPDKDN